MKKRKDLNHEGHYISASRINDIAWIKLKGNMMLQSTNLQCRDELIDYLDRASADKFVKTVVLFSSDESTGYQEYAKFYRMVGDRKVSENEIWRMYRSFDSLIKKILESSKFFIAAAQGKLYPQILSVSLACDYRIITDNTFIKNMDSRVSVVAQWERI